ncbi:MAG: hypothetical protein WA317_18950, partial [Mycobacterium sp.]|uniref:hypothetical protein n=1 Tax=Mycobacterium sp. TaxID=1785 RepID=UPI003CC60FE6
MILRGVGFVFGVLQALVTGLGLVGRDRRLRKFSFRRYFGNRLLNFSGGVRGIGFAGVFGFGGFLIRGFVDYQRHRCDLRLRGLRLGGLSLGGLNLGDLTLGDLRLRGLNFVGLRLADLGLGGLNFDGLRLADLRLGDLNFDGLTLR